MNQPGTRTVLLLSAVLLAAALVGVYFGLRSPASSPSPATPAPNRPPTAAELRKPPPTPRVANRTGPLHSRESGEPSTHPRAHPDSRMGTIEGYVFDAAHAPVSGARVVLARSATRSPVVVLTGKEKRRRDQVARLFQYYPEDAKSLHPIATSLPPAPPVPPIGTTVTDGRGTFHFEGRFAPGLVVWATKGQDLAAPKDAVPGQKSVLVLRPGASLVGFVTSGEDGRQIADATIRVRSSRVDTEVQSDSRGRFSVPALDPGAVRVVATAKGFATTVLTGITLAAGDTKQISVRMTKGYDVTATVLGSKEDSDDVPLAGATVGIVRPGDDAFAIGKTDKAGQVVFHGLSPGKYLGNAAAKGHLASGPEVVEVKDRDATHEFDLDPAVKSTLEVYDERGVPIAGAVLYTANPDEDFDQRLSRRVGVTNEAGEFEFPFDWDGAHAVLFVAASGYAMASVSPDDPSEANTLRVVLHEGSTIRGTVKDTDGSPIAKALVTIDVIAARDDQTDVTATVLTNEKGEYEFDYLPPGDVDVTAKAPGYADADTDFNVRTTTSPQVRDLTMEKQ